MNPLDSQKITISKFGLRFYSFTNDIDLKIVIPEKWCITDEKSSQRVEPNTKMKK